MNTRTHSNSCCFVLICGCWGDVGSILVRVNYAVVTATARSHLPEVTSVHLVPRRSGVRRQQTNKARETAHNLQNSHVRNIFRIVTS